MDIAAVDKATHDLIGLGVRVFQVYRFADTEALHIRRLLGWADIPLDACVIDMGCGIGEVAKSFSLDRPDLDFTLVNISEFQLSYADPAHICLAASFLNVPQPDETFDCVLFMFSIGHEPAAPALAEAARLLKPGGVLFISDMIRVSGDNLKMRALVDYEVHPRAAMEAAAFGFDLDWYMEPTPDESFGEQLLGDGFNSIFAGTIPAIWRFTKRRDS